jgi:hypothetical protein
MKLVPSKKIGTIPIAKYAPSTSKIISTSF